MSSEDLNVQHKISGNDGQGGTGRATLIVMLCTALSRILGFFRLAVIGAVFGGGAIADVLNAVFLIPNNLRKLLAEGALSTAFIPVLSASVHGQNDKHKSEQLIGSMFSFQIWVLLPLMIACIIFAVPLSRLLFPFADELVQALGPGGTSIGVNKAHLAADLFPWMMHYLVFVSFSAIIMAILNVHHQFTIPALAPLMFSFSVIGMILILSNELYVWAQVAGVLLGGSMQLGILILGFRRLRYRLSIPLFFWRNSDFKQVLVLLVPVIGSSTVFTFTELIATMFAAAMPTGSASALTNAMVFWQLPFGMFSASISTVLFPRLASFIARDHRDALKSTLLYGLRMIMYLLIPSTVLLLTLGREFIAVTLQRGNFLPENTVLTALVLQAYAVGMFAIGGVGFLQRYFYAAKAQRVPFVAAIIIGVIDIIISVLALLAGWGVVGLALASSISGLFGFIWLLSRVRLHLAGLKLRSLLRAFIQALGASLPMALIGLLYIHFTGNWYTAGGTVENWLRILVLLLMGGGSVLLMYRLLGVDEFFSILRRKPPQEINAHEEI
jgi:putative peptidoglycan lipid II flippase